MLLTYIVTLYHIIHALKVYTRDVVIIYFDKKFGSLWILLLQCKVLGLSTIVASLTELFGLLNHYKIIVLNIIV